MRQMILRKNWGYFKNENKILSRRSDRLRKIKQEAGVKITNSIVKAIRNLVDNPRKCPTVGSILDLESTYHYLHIAHYYVFYRITQESIGYWGE